MKVTVEDSYRGFASSFRWGGLAFGASGLPSHPTDCMSAPAQVDIAHY